MFEVNDRPIIAIDTELHQSVDASSCALSTLDGLFQRDATLVQVLRGEGDLLSALEAPVVRPVGLPTLREILTKVAVFEKYDGRKQAQVRCMPTDPLVAA